MHGLVYAKSLGVRPIKTATEKSGPLSRHLVLRQNRLELDVACGGAWLQAFDQIRKRKTSPWDNHGPAFHATHPIGAVCHAQASDQIVQIVSCGLLHQTFDRNRPRLYFEVPRISRRITSVSAEFVVVVVRRGICIRRDPLARVVRSRFRLNRNCGRNEKRGSDFYEFTTVLVHSLRSHFRRRNICCAMNKHIEVSST